MQLTKLFGFAGSWPGCSPDDLIGYAAKSCGDAPYLTSRVSSPSISCAIAPLRASDDQIEVAIQGKPYWKGSPGSPVDANLARAALIAYRTQGTAFLSQLGGSFAVAIIDTKQQSVVLAVDRIGIERLAYSASSEGIVFSSSAEAIARAPQCAATLRAQALFDYLLLHMVPAPTTVYSGVEKLRPGTVAVFGGGRVSVQRYWQPTFVEVTAASEKDLAKDLHSSLESAVARCNPGSSTGAFLSGGLDSSTVSGMLGKVQGGAAQTFSIGFGVDAYDELAFARIAARHFGFKSHEYSVTADDVVDAFPRIAAAYDEPFGNSSAVPTYFCAKFAKSHGVDHLLAGDGGDEIFGGNERYARQRVFEAYQRIPQVIRQSLLEPTIGLVNADRAPLPLRKLRSYVDQARIRLPERLESWNFMYRTPANTIFNSDFLASIDVREPFAIMQAVYETSESASLLNKMLFYDWHFTLADNDLRKVNTMCDLAGVQVSYPMLDDDVINLSTKVPSRMKMRGGELRSFYKNAMRGFLPEEILNKTKHGFGLPFGDWLKTHRPLADLIYGHLHDLKRRGIVQDQFLDSLIQDHKSGHASYFGYALWDLAMLEAWLKIHGNGLEWR